MTLALTVGVLGYDPFGPRLAGPALRSWHLALQLARICHVELWTEGPAPDPPGGTNLRIRNFHPELIRGASAQYAGFLLPAQAALRDRTLFQLDCPVVVDCYDPFPAETAHLLAGAGRSEQQFRTRLQAWASLHAVVHGDYHLVATEAQRGYLGGLLVATGRLTPGLTHQDRAIPGRTLLVPTGYDPSAVDLIGRGHQGALALLERWGIRVGAGERFLLWSGGLWPWLDPVALLEAFLPLADADPTLHLVFPGAASPNPNSPEVPVVAALQAALRGAGGAGRQVHLVEWVPYDLWPALAAHASAHCLVDRPGWESALASRTRFVDALAYGVRVVHTGHDPLALAMAQELGAAFRAGWNDRGSLTAALRAALEVPWDRSDPDAWQPLRHRYHWSSVATLLLDAVRQGLTRSPDRASTEEVTAWIEHYPVPEPPGKLRRLWERWRK